MTEEFLNPHGYHGHFHYAEKKGYSGTGIYSKVAPDRVEIGFGSDFEMRGARTAASAATLPLRSRSRKRAKERAAASIRTSVRDSIPCARRAARKARTSAGAT